MKQSIREIKVAIVCLVMFTGMMKVSAEVDGEDRSPLWGPTTAGCRFSIAAHRESYGFDQSIQLRLTIENMGKEPVHVLLASLMEAYRFEVRLPNGKPAPLTLEGRRQTEIGETTLVRLGPGESAIDEVPMLNRLYDMTLSGEYTVTVHRRVLPPGDDQEWVEVLSNRLEITVGEDEDVATEPK